MWWFVRCSLAFLIAVAASIGTSTAQTRSSMIQQFEGVYYPLTTTTSPCNDVTFNAAITAIQALSPPRNILQLTPVDGAGAACTWTLSADVTVPRGITLRIPDGVTVTADSPRVLTLNGPLDATDPDWFVGTGTRIINYISWGSAEAFSTTWNHFVLSGGVHGTSGSKTSPAFATRAWVNGRDINEAANTITYSATANDICWTISSADNDGIAGWTRVGATAYYYLCEGDTTPNQPTLPPNSAWLMGPITITAGAIDAVTDISTRRIVGTYTVDASRTVGRNGVWVVDHGSTISLGAGVTLTFGGRLIASPSSTVFTGVGSVVFTGTATPEIWVDWFGALNDGSSDVSAAVNKAIAS